MGWEAWGLTPNFGKPPPFLDLIRRNANIGARHRTLKGETWLYFSNFTGQGVRVLGSRVNCLAQLQSPLRRRLTWRVVKIVPKLSIWTSFGRVIHFKSGDKIPRSPANASLRRCV